MSADPEGDPELRPVPGQLFRLAWAFYLVMACAGVLWVGLREGRIPLALFVDLERWWLDAGLGVAVGIFLVGLWKIAERLLARARELEGQLRALLGPLDSAEALSLALLSGFSEELFFRGAVQGSWGWFWACVVFAALHSGPGRAFRLWTLFAALAGAALGALVLWRANLLPAVLAHTLVNAVNLHRLRKGPLAAPPDRGGR